MPASLARLIAGAKAVSLSALIDDGVVAGVDEVVDGGDLRGDVLADRHHLELLDLRGDFRLRDIGLRGLDHLDAPEVGDEPVRKRDTIGSRLRRILEELGLVRPRNETLGIGGRSGHDLRAGGQRRLRYAASERNRSNSLQILVQRSHHHSSPSTRDGPHSRRARRILDGRFWRRPSYFFVGRTLSHWPERVEGRGVAARAEDGGVPR